MILLKLIFVMVWGFIYFLYTYLFQHHLEKPFLSLSNCFESKSSWLFMCGSISSDSVLGIDLFVYVYTISTLSWFYRKYWDQCTSSKFVLLFQVNFLFFFFKLILAILCPMNFHINFRNCLTFIPKKLLWEWHHKDGGIGVSNTHRIPETAIWT